MLGLETAFAVAVEELDMPLAGLLSLFTDRPAQIAGISDTQGAALAEGRPANLTVLDLEHEWQVEGRNLASLASNTPFEGRRLRGRARHTFFNGEQVLADFEVTR
jgi:dihydroorotase